MSLGRRLTLVFASYLMFAIGCGGDTGSPTAGTTPSEANTPTTTTESVAAPSAETEAPVVIKEGWGNLKGKFVLSGTLPSPSPLQVTKDQEVCGKHNLVDESVVVNSANKGIANVVVHLYLGRGDKAPSPHESYASSATTPVVIDNNQCRFEPHIRVLQPEQTLVIKNTDTVGHNTKIDSVENPGFNQTLPSGAEIEHQFADAERRPAAVSCSIHPWMRGWLVVQDTPYAIVSDENGEFEIANLPSGNWKFQVWHEKANMVSKTVIDGKPTSWSKGRFEVTIQAGETADLGVVELAADLFKD